MIPLYALRDSDARGASHNLVAVSARNAFLSAAIIALTCRLFERYWHYNHRALQPGTLFRCSKRIIPAISSLSMRCSSAAPILQPGCGFLLIF